LIQFAAMRHAPLFTLALMLCACPQSQPASQTSSAPTKETTPETGMVLAVGFSGTESDPWTMAIVGALGAELGFDPWATAGQSGHLDVYGPYAAQFNGEAIRVSLAMAGLQGVSDMLSQQAIGEEMRMWVENQKPAVVMLDGDQLQLFAGREMDPALPIVFTGCVAEKDVYYQSGREVTGVYRRHSLPGVMKEVWAQAPQAQSIALVGDGSPPSEGQLLIFQSQLEMAYFKDKPCLVGDRVSDWAGLKSVLGGLNESADAIIICGVGVGDDVRGWTMDSYPAELLDGIDKPVIALGPSPLDQSGATVLRLRPVEHVKYALKAVGDVLEGKSAGGILPVTPPEMEMFRSERAESGPAEK
jgi:hypothetical protein